MRNIAIFLLLSTLMWAQAAPSPVPDEKSPAPQAQSEQSQPTQSQQACPCCVKTAQKGGQPMQCPMMAKGAKPGERCCQQNAKGAMQCGKNGATCCAASGKDACCASGKMACAHAAKGSKHGHGCCGMSCPMMQSGN
jgi:hypothetical protein